MAVNLVTEPDETFTMALENPINALLDRAVAVGRILDSGTGLPGLTVHDAADSSAAHLHFLAELSAQSNQTVTVDYATQPGTATAPRDCLPVTGTLVLTPGQTAAFIEVTLFDNSVGERTKRFCSSSPA